VTTYVLVEAWQQQCCGVDFEIGSVVRWDVRPAEADWLAHALGQQWAAAVWFVEDHHGTRGGAAHELAGVVRSIRVLTVGRELGTDPQYGPVMLPVAGSGRLREVPVADRWETASDENGADRSFDGWIVGLDVEPLVAEAE
jgi:hypothetical protein